MTNHKASSYKNLQRHGSPRPLSPFSLVVWFMGHGDKTYLHVKDGRIHRRLELIEPVTEIEWYIKKPKLFFIQACAVKKDRRRFSSTCK